MNRNKRHVENLGGLVIGLYRLNLFVVTDGMTD